MPAALHKAARNPKAQHGAIVILGLIRKAGFKIGVYGQVGRFTQFPQVAQYLAITGRLPDP